MVPSHPPLPTTCSLRFQPAVGSHTSTLMSESLDGVSVASTRQNSGTALYGSGRPAGGTNAPAATNFALLIFACGRDNDVRLSHEAAKTGAATVAAQIRTAMVFMESH